MLNQKVLRTVDHYQAPAIFGHIDIMANQRPRIIRAVAESDIVILVGEARLLIEYLDKEQIREMSKKVQAKNPYDIGKVYLDAKYTVSHLLPTF